MNTKLIAVVGIVALAFVPGVVYAQDAGPPVGTWQGPSSDGRTMVTLYLGSSGEFMAHSTGSQPVGGRWIWEPTLGGGFVTLRAGGRNGGSMFLNVTYLDANTINVAVPGTWATLTRQ